MGFTVDQTIDQRLGGDILSPLSLLTDSSPSSVHPPGDNPQLRPDQAKIAAASIRMPGTAVQVRRLSWGLHRRLKSEIIPDREEHLRQHSADGSPATKLRSGLA